MKCLINNYSIFDLFTNVNNFAWFLWTLFFISLIIVSIDRLCCKTSNVQLFLVVLLLVVIISLIIPSLINTNIFAIKNIGLNLQYFACGYVIRKLDVSSLMKHWLLWVTVPLFILFVLFWHRESITIFSIELMGVKANLYRIITAYLGCYSIWLVFKLLMEKKTFLSQIGKASLGIYLTHFPILAVILSLNMPLVINVLVISSLAYLSVYLIRKSNYLKPIIGEHIIR